MTQPEEAVGGATDEPIIAAEPTLEDRFAALTGEDPEQPEESPEDAPAASDEPTQDDIEDEPDEAPAITPPVSWTAEEKEEFSQLPRALQETLTRREAEREKFVQTKANEAKSARLQVQEQATRELQGIHAQNIAALQVMLPDIPDQPSEYLRLNDPMAYAEQAETYKWAVAQHQTVQQLLSGIAQQHAQAQQALDQQKGEYTRSVLADQFPEFLDSEKGPELKQQLRSTALALGFTDNDLTDLTAPQIIALRNVSEMKVKADKYDALQAKKMETVRAAKDLPRVSRPGSPQGRGEAANQRYIADRQAMRQGDKDAGARVFAKFL